MRAGFPLLVLACVGASSACDFGAYMGAVRTSKLMYQRCMLASGSRCECLEILVSPFADFTACPGAATAIESLEQSRGAACAQPAMLSVQQQACDERGFFEDRRRAFKSEACGDPARQCECITGIQRSYLMNANCPGATQDARQLQRSVDAACDFSPHFLRAGY